MVINNRCRICGAPLLSNVFDLGQQALTGMFIKNGRDVPVVPMALAMCSSSECGLVQMNENYDLNILYGEHYGYASGLNPSMVRHLEERARKLQLLVPLEDNDIVIDIGSNDSTTLAFFPEKVNKIGVDITGRKFADNYKKIDALLIDEFFPSLKLKKVLGTNKVKIISSYSCFYDLPDPVSFAREVSSLLSDDGVWCLEQSYMPFMLEQNSFDTICHEHLEYYKLIDIYNICDASGLKILDVEFNDINSGSFCVTVALKNSHLNVSENVSDVLKNEKKVDWVGEFEKFNRRVDSRKSELLNLLRDLKSQGKRVVGLGASTKGNVLLQHYGIDSNLVESIGEVNKDKYGCETPGTAIPIIGEDEALESKPDYILILPWHFKKFFIGLDKLKGCKLIFPLPKVEIVEL